jgi:hypothetical protein
VVVSDKGEESQQSNLPSFSVVGIGASAGGVEALSIYSTIFLPIPGWLSLPSRTEQPNRRAICRTQLVGTRRCR